MVMLPAKMRGDSFAVEGLPLALMVTMVVLAITVPLIFGSFKAYDRGRVENTLISEIESFSSVVQQLYISGPGNSALIDFNAMVGSLTGIDYITIGDEAAGSAASVIKYKIQDHQEVAFAVTAPNVPMTSANNTGFSVMPGNNVIKAECVFRPGSTPETLIILELAQ